MNKIPLVLVVEDDAEIADIVMAYLRRDGLEAIHANTGALAINYHAQHAPSLIVLDIRMPGMDGWSVLTEIRKKSNTPIIMLTANDDDADKLSALRIGADDYVVKPFNPAELVARIRAVLRRTLFNDASAKPTSYKTHYLEVQLDEHRVILSGSEKDIGHELTSTEFKLLVHMIKQPRKVFSRQELMEACFTERDALERTVDSHISKLRKKLEMAGLAGVPESVRGFGYRLGK